MKTPGELIDYIDHVVASLDADYGTIYETTRALLEQFPTETGHRLRWNLVHQHTALSTLLNDLKRHQVLLNRGLDAG